MNIDVEVLDDIPESSVRPIPWSRFVKELLKSYEPPLRALATQRGMKHALDQVTALAALDDEGNPILTEAGRPAPLVKTTADLNAEMLARLIRAQPATNSPNTVRSLLRYVRTVCAIAVESGYLRTSPFKRNPIGRLVRKAPAKGRRHLSRAEIRAVLDLLAADVAARTGWAEWKARRLQALVAIVAYCGLRKNEALHLRVEDIDLAGRVIFVRPRVDHRLKTERSAAAVPMPDALVPLLEDWLRHRLDAPKGFPMPADVPWLIPGCRRRTPWDNGPVGQKPLDIFKALCKRVGILDANLQQLRRSLSTHLRFHGTGTGMIARVLRHSTEVNEEFYHESDLDNLRSSVAGLEF